MRLSLRFFHLALFVSLLVAFVSDSAFAGNSETRTASGGVYDDVIANVSSLITNLMAEHGLVGCGVALVDGSNVVWKTGFGYADKERGIVADEDTVFMIGSCSKTFGAIAVMQLVEEGLIDLDAPFTNALPSFSIHQRFADNIITPRTILTHHSGIPGDIFNGMFTVRENLSFTNWLENYLADDYTLLPTNTVWAYNNSGFVLLGNAIEHLTGVPLADYARTNLFNRMGMTSTSLLRDLPEIEENLARPYIGGVLYPDEYCNGFFAGSIYSSASDMSKYMKTLLAGGMGENARVIKADTLTEMTTKQNADVSLDQFSSRLNMGIAFILDPPQLQYMGKVCWHDGGTAYFRTMMRVALDAELGFFISWNSAEGGTLNSAIADSALKWAYEAKTGVPPPADVVPPESAIAVPPAGLLDLATGTVVKATGYDVFSTNAAGGLLWIKDAHSSSSIITNFVYRENGWFTPSNSMSPQITFTQTQDRVITVMRTFSGGVTNSSLLGERSQHINGFAAEWNSRTGFWWSVDYNPDSLSWIQPGVIDFNMLEIYTEQNMLCVAPLGMRDYACDVFSATNANLGFAAGIGRNKGTSLRAVITNGQEHVVWMGVRFRSENSLPVLAPGSATNSVISGDSQDWYRLEVPSNTTCVVDLTADGDMTGYIYDSDMSPTGRSGKTGVTQITTTNASVFYVAVVRNGLNTGPYQLAVHNDAAPFYKEIPPATWPEDLSSKSNLYGNLSFGHVFVHENRTNQTGRLLKLAVALMRSTKRNALPLIFCNGGPGESGIRTVYQHYLRDFADDYDVYLLDQRGIGYSQPDLTLRDEETPQEIQYRFRMLEGGDISALNTVESSHDIEDISTALNLNNINLYGLSYGTTLAQTLMRREPVWLRAVVLDGVVAPDIPAFNETGSIRYDALNSLFADVAADDVASLRYKDFPETVFALADSLQAQPVTVEIEGADKVIDGVTFIDAVLDQMTSSDLKNRETIPSIVQRATLGDYAALAGLYAYNMDTNVFIINVVSDVMGAVVMQHDFMPFNSMDAVSNNCAALPDMLRLSTLAYVQALINDANEIEIGAVDASFTEPVTSSIPTLVINGMYDTQTGTNWAARVASNLKNAYLVNVPTVGHGVLAGGYCPQMVVREFLANPSTAPDTACVDAMTLVFDLPYPAPGNGDYSGNGTADMAVYDQVSGLWYIRDIHGNIFVNGLQWGGAGFITVSGDYSGNGVNDMAVYNTATGDWYIRTVDGVVLKYGEQWGGPGFVPVPGDYDGDGISDMAVYDQFSGNWYIKRGADGEVLIFGEQWGGTEFVPVSGDYTGDGRSDMAVYHEASGKWYIRTVDGLVLVFGEQWGGPGYVPVSGDYSGDGAIDITVYHQATGLWFIRTLCRSIILYGEQWGGPGYAPMSGDFNGDGISDLAVYDIAEGIWFVKTVSGEVLSAVQQWGGGSFVPVTESDSSSRPTGLTTVYRFSGHSHFLTADWNEVLFLSGQSNWTYEQVAWYALPFRLGGAVPLYRLANPVNGAHMLTVDAGVYDALTANGGWAGEGIAMYVWLTGAGGRFPVYKLYNENTGLYLFTADKSEKNALTGNSETGFVYQGVAFYVYLTP